MKDYKELNDMRTMYNKQILEVLKEYLEQYPSIRFNQALYNLNIIEQNAEFQTRDSYNDEPLNVLKRMKGNI